MNTLNQIAAVTMMSLRSLPQRSSTSFVIVAGTAGVVAVLISVLSLSVGLTRTLGATGNRDRVVVLYAGAQSETGSTLTRDAIFTILDAPGIRRDAAGKPLAAAEAVSSLWIPIAANGTPGSATIRGVSAASFAVRPEIRLIDGRSFESGLKEVIVGRAAQHKFAGLGIGERFVSGDSEWRVVGVFESSGDLHESELLTDVDSLQAAVHRTSFNSVTAWLADSESFDALKAATTGDPTLTVDVHRESDYYADLSNDFSSFLAVIANVIGVIMAIGAVFGALNTMYAAVSARTIEIATLRAIGFGPTAVVVSVFVESLLLALAGALLGAAIAWLFFNGNTVSTVSGEGLAQVVFDLRIGSDLVITGIEWACVLGMIGGLFPAIRAARLPVTAALRAS